MRRPNLEQRGISWTWEEWGKFVERWVEYRRGQRFTQAQFADALGLPVLQVKRIERWREVPTGEEVLRFEALVRRVEQERRGWWGGASGGI